jgi:hypothetical protein
MSLVHQRRRMMPAASGKLPEAALEVLGFVGSLDSALGFALRILMLRSG